MEYGLHRRAKPSYGGRVLLRRALEFGPFRKRPAKLCPFLPYAILDFQMARQDDNPLVKAESLIKRALHRLGEGIDNRLFRETGSKLSEHEITDLASLLETAIESSLREDEAGLRRLAPNEYKVLLKFEARDRIGDDCRKALESELSGAASEYIRNRRYHTAGGIEMKVAFDVFIKAASIQAHFRDAASSAETPDSGAQPLQREIELKAGNGATHRLAITRGGAPLVIGRAAGVALRLDDESVSRHHCSVALKENGELVIGDLGSANGTMVNGSVINAGAVRVLAEGDVIRVGDLELGVTIQGR